jgi:hypothetical protein
MKVREFQLSFILAPSFAHLQTVWHLKLRTQLDSKRRFFPSIFVTVGSSLWYGNSISTTLRRWAKSVHHSCTSTTRFNTIVLICW